MDSSELQLYQHQLEQVESALAADPSNAELQNLRDELANLINLTKSLQGGTTGASHDATVASKPAAATPAASSSSSSSARHAESRASQCAGTQHRFATGDDCSARYAGDGRWYPARIVSVAGSSDNPVYSVIFKGYNNTENLTASDLRPSKPRAVSPPQSASPAPEASASASTSTSTSNKKLTPEEEAERERRRRRNERKTEKLAAKQAMQVDKAAAWQKFAKKGVKKGVIPGQKSIFKTPEDPYAKVGVVGGGRGMTAYNSRTKHVYEGAEQQ
ncbi:hypothetical protein ACQY0O_003500 [Thecaphora frezii]